MFKCTKCGAKFIGKWLNKQMQYGKLTGAGYTKEQTDKMIPLCPVCFKQALKKK